MNNRNGVFIFFLFALILVIIGMQILSMIQSDRVYERINRIVDIVENAGSFTAACPQHTDTGPDGDKYPGDEGDWLVRCLSAEPLTLYDILAGSSWASRWIVSGNIYESMIEYKPDEFEYKGRLAEEFSISEDGLEIYFKLRGDIHFSDGTPITTDDVIFTFETITNTGIDAAGYANYFRDVERRSR